MVTKTITSLRHSLLEQDRYSQGYDRRIRTLSPGFKEQFWQVKGAIGGNVDLSGRMYECGEIDNHNNMKLCGVPLCPRCFMTRRGKETGKAIKKFRDATNEQLVFLTLLLPITSDIPEIGSILDTEKRRIINMIARKRRHDDRWNDVHMTGFWEIDRIAAEDIEKLGRNKKIALDQLGAPMFSTKDTTVWVPHLHAIIDCASLGIYEIREAFRADGRRGAYRVDAQPFHKHRSVTENLKQIVRYSMKFRIEDNYKAGSRFGILDDGLLGDREITTERQWWPKEDIRAYAEWAKTTRGGFRSLRFEIGKAKKKETGLEDTETKGTSTNKEEFCDRNGCLVVPEFSSKEFHKTESNFKYMELDTGHDIYEYHETCRYNEPLHDTNWLTQAMDESAMAKAAEHCQSACSSRTFMPADNLQEITLFAAASKGPMERHTVRSLA